MAGRAHDAHAWCRAGVLDVGAKEVAAEVGAGDLQGRASDGDLHRRVIEVARGGGLVHGLDASWHGRTYRDVRDRATQRHEQDESGCDR